MSNLLTDIVSLDGDIFDNFEALSMCPPNESGEIPSLTFPEDAYPLVIQTAKTSLNKPLDAVLILGGGEGAVLKYFSNEKELDITHVDLSASLTLIENKRIKTSTYKMSVGEWMQAHNEKFDLIIVDYIPKENELDDLTKQLVSHLVNDGVVISQNKLLTERLAALNMEIKTPKIKLRDDRDEVAVAVYDDSCRCAII